MNISFDASELNALTGDLGNAGHKSVPLAAVAVKKILFLIERDAKAFAPVDTGNLKGSISTTVRGLSGETGPTADYGHHVELGTSRQAPAAYMGPAFDRNAHIFEAALLSIADDLG